MFPLKMFQEMEMEEMKTRVNEVLKRVELENSNNKMPSEASGGMQKRVAIARAIVNQPKYLFCDEPNSGLDPKTAIVIDNLIKDITEEYKITTVINSHDMNSVMEIGQKIVFLKDGKTEWQGDKNEIFITENKAVTDFVYSSNLYKKIRKMLNDLCIKENFKALFPPINLCGDNAAMIAMVGLEKFKLNKFDNLDFAPKPRWPLDENAPFLKGAGIKL